MTLQSRAEMTYHEKIVVDFAKYYDEIISEEKQEELEANFGKEDLTDEESDEIYKNMFQAYMDELYYIIRNGQDHIPPKIIDPSQDRLLD
ncbi:MAG: hypothetical protein FAF03_06630 [Epsilonproteobacteria bacterium]|nr:hypothetical protein [Campylobacterota bacterium]